MKCLFSDCFSILILPDISKWNNYNENDINLIPDYNEINDFINFESLFVTTAQESQKILNDPSFSEKQLIEKMKRLNLI